MKQLPSDILQHIGQYVYINPISKHLKLTTKNKWSIVKTFITIDKECKQDEPSEQEINYMYYIVLYFEKIHVNDIIKKLIKLQFSYEPFISYFISKSYSFIEKCDILGLSYTAKNEAFIKCIQEVVLLNFNENIKTYCNIVSYHHERDLFITELPDSYTAELICLLDTKKLDIIDEIRHYDISPIENSRRILTTACYFLLYHRNLSIDDQLYLGSCLTYINIHGLACMWKQEDNIIYKKYMETHLEIVYENRDNRLIIYLEDFYKCFIENPHNIKLYNDTIKENLSYDNVFVKCYFVIPKNIDLIKIKCEEFRFLMMFILTPFTDKELSAYILSNDMLHEVLDTLVDVIAQLNLPLAKKIYEAIQVFDFNIFKYLVINCIRMKIIINMTLPKESTSPKLLNAPEYRNLGKCHINILEDYPYINGLYKNKIKELEDTKRSFTPKKWKPRTRTRTRRR